jgi:hypothetical protein
MLDLSIQKSYKKKEIFFFVLFSLYFVALHLNLHTIRIIESFLCIVYFSDMYKCMLRKYYSFMNEVKSILKEKKI